MRQALVEKINHINLEFYQTFASSFSATRGRVQPGVRKILDGLPAGGSWLDIGCGNGTLAETFLERGREGRYFGLDASSALVEHARDKISRMENPGGLDIKFEMIDFLGDGWRERIPDAHWHGAFMFAVLHHVPGKKQRLEMIREINSLLDEGAELYLSVWQVQKSPRLVRRLVPWDEVDIDGTEVDEGDVLMDWRAEGEGEPDEKGIRHVHIFTEDELSDLGEKCGFAVKDRFYSDGKEGNLGLYQVWSKK